MSRVYCSDCRYYHYEMWDGGFGGDYEECRSKPSTKHTYLRRSKVYAEPSEKNKNGDCREFERKRSVGEIFSELVNR